MLRLKTIHNDTYNLLRELSESRELDSFALAGGTALALMLGHRISVDLDFFTQNEFAGFELLDRLNQRFDTENCSTMVNSLSLSIKRKGLSVKIDFIRHDYPLVNPIRTVGSIRLFSLEDIIAMKLNAIANRGAKKDFYDIYALLAKFSLREMLGFFEVKYPKMNTFAVTKSLVYFEDADLDPDPISLVDVSWEDIKKEIQTKLADSI